MRSGPDRSFHTYAMWPFFSRCGPKSNCSWRSTILPLVFKRNTINNILRMSRNVSKRTIGNVCQAKIQISRRILDSKQCNFCRWTTKTDHCSDAQAERLIWVFVRQICQKVRFLLLRRRILINKAPIRLDSNKNIGWSQLKFLELHPYHRWSKMQEKWTICYN